MCHMPTLLEGLRRCRDRGRGHGLGHRPGRRHRGPPGGPRRRRHRGGGGGGGAHHRQPAAAGGQGPDQLRAARGDRRAHHPGRVGRRASSVRAGHRGGARGPRDQARALHRARRPPACRRRAGHEHLQPRHHGHRRRHAGPGPRHRPALLQPARPPCASSRSSAGRSRRPQVLERGNRAHARLGQDAGAVHVDPRVHRQPRGPPVLRRGPADARGRGRRRRHPRRRACARPASGWGRSS